MQKLEKEIQKEIVKYLRDREWLVEVLSVSESMPVTQWGIPDLYAWRSDWGQRWIEVKRPSGSSLTRDQKAKFPTWEAFGLGIWIMHSASEPEYAKLFKPPNWREYLPKKARK